MGAVSRLGVQKARELPLGQHDGPRETVEVHTHCLKDGSAHFPDFIDGLPRSAGHVLEFPVRRLKPAVRFSAGTALGPQGSVSFPARRKNHLGKAVYLLPAHDLVAARADAGKPRRLAVKGQRDGVKNGCLARARGAGDEKDAFIGKFPVRKVDDPFAGEAVQIAETQLLDFHDLPLSSPFPCPAALQGRLRDVLRDPAGPSGSIRAGGRVPLP